MAPRDDTPLPPPRPPSLDIAPYMKVLAARKRRLLPWTIALLCGALAWGALARLRFVDQKSQRAISDARNEAAEHRAARFAAEAEARRLGEENERLKKALAEAAAAIAKATIAPAHEAAKKPENTP